MVRLMTINKTTHGFADNSKRNKKAKKIHTIISNNFSCSINPKKAKLLDIGTGNGEIANYLGQYYDVTSIDVYDQRQVSASYHFEKVKNEIIPLHDNSMDIVISNHVIEHTTDAKKHLSEIYRVLKKDGVAYLATPNRLWPFEVHYKIWLLHYLPYSWFHHLLKRLKIYKEDVKLLSWWQIKKMLKINFDVKEFSSEITKNPATYEMNVSPYILKVINIVPLKVIKIFMLLNPTIVVILRKKSE